MNKSIGIDMSGFNLFGIICGVGGLAFAAWQAKKSNDLARKLNVCIDDLAGKTDIDIEEDVVRSAVQNAVEKKANAVVKSAADGVISKVTNDLDSDIRKTVDGEYGKLKSSINSRIDKRVSELNMDDIAEKARKKVEENVFKEVLKFSGIGKLFDRTEGSLGGMSSGEVAKILEQFTWSPDKMKVLNMLIGDRR